MKTSITNLDQHEIVNVNGGNGTNKITICLPIKLMPLPPMYVLSITALLSSYDYFRECTNNIDSNNNVIENKKMTHCVVKAAICFVEKAATSFFQNSFCFDLG